MVISSVNTINFVSLLVPHNPHRNEQALKEKKEESACAQRISDFSIVKSVKV